MLSDNRLPYHKKKTRHKRRGSTLVEFALIVPILLALLMGIMEFGILARNSLTLSNATREGARTASLGGTTATIRSRVISAAKPITITNSEIYLKYSTDNGVTYSETLGDTGSKNNAPSGSLVQVNIQKPHQSITRFIPWLSTYKHNVFVVMRREAT